MSPGFNRLSLVNGVDVKGVIGNASQHWMFRVQCSRLGREPLNVTPIGKN